MQVKTGQELPREGVEAALDEVLSSYKSELGLTDKESDQLEHFQVGTCPPTNTHTLASYQSHTFASYEYTHPCLLPITHACLLPEHTPLPPTNTHTRAF